MSTNVLRDGFVDALSAEVAGMTNKDDIATLIRSKMHRIFCWWTDDSVAIAAIAIYDKQCNESSEWIGDPAYYDGLFAGFADTSLDREREYLIEGLVKNPAFDMEMVIDNFEQVGDWGNSFSTQEGFEYGALIDCLKLEYTTEQIVGFVQDALAYEKEKN